MRPTHRIVVSCAIIALALSWPLSASVRTWTGTTSGQWSDASNWGGTAPVAGDDLVFPAGAAHLTNTNDFPSNTQFNSLTFANGYVSNGAPLNVGAGGLIFTQPGTTFGFARLSFPIVLDAAQTWSATNNTAYQISGDVDLNGSALTFNSGSTAAGTVSGVISGNGAIVVNGLRGATFLRSNTYTGPTTVNVNSSLSVQTASGLGVGDGTAANGTTVSGMLFFCTAVTQPPERISLGGNGEIVVGPCSPSTAPLTLTGPIDFTGPVAYIVPGSPQTPNLILSGPLSGSPAFVNFFGVNVTLSSTASTLGPSTIQVVGGTLKLGATDALPANTGVQFGTGSTPSGGILDLNGFDEDFVGFEGLGQVNLGANTLTTHFPNLGSGFPLATIVTGSGNLLLNGPGPLTFSGASTATGTLTNNASSALSFASTGTWPGPVVFNSGSGNSLVGGSAVGPVTVSSGVGLAVSPTARTGGLTLASGSTLKATLSGGSTVLAVTGAATLGGAALTLASSGTVAAGTHIALIDNDGSDPVSGTFAGIPEGAHVTAGGQTFTISYAGGTGNDVVLSAIGPTTTTLAASPNPSDVSHSVTLTATIGVAPAVVAPTGTMTFKEGTNTLGAVTVSSATATLTVPPFALGSHSLTATYSGDANFTGSTSAVLTLPVIQSIPMLDPRLLMLLAAVIAAAGAFMLRR